ncbi:MAG: hypothetical protein IT532_00295 [Burkholderiales bacterium]|nr:hypothetical protein [Burkholderiales bacterium]
MITLPYYRFPDGMFDGPDYSGPWTVMRYRPMPCTPAGDVVVDCPTREQADDLAARLNQLGVDLAAAREMAKGSRP